MEMEAFDKNSQEILGTIIILYRLFYIVLLPTYYNRDYSLLDNLIGKGDMLRSSYDIGFFPVFTKKANAKTFLVQITILYSSFKFSMVGHVNGFLVS